MRALIFAILATLSTAAGSLAFTFQNIDGGTIDTSKWDGQPILVVNTASLCGFTDQYGDLQKLYDRYRSKGLVVLAIPSDDFQQELASEAEVKDFCAMHFGLDLPMTEITPVRGASAHPFYKWVRKEAGFTPRWNFNKVLLAPDGSVAATYGSSTKPLGRKITGKIDRLLADS